MKLLAAAVPTIAADVAVKAETASAPVARLIAAAVAPAIAALFPD